MLSRLYDEVTTYWELEAEGREQRDCLSKKFHICKTGNVNANEFKLQLAKTKWFKDAKFKDNPYLIPDTDNSKFISFDQAFVDVSTILGWDDTKKSKIAKNGIIPELCFRCLSTNVQSAEWCKLILDSGFFGSGVTATYIPPRRDPPPFVGLDLFINNNPDRIAWPQIRKLYHDFHKYAKREMMLDEMFSGLQHREYKKLSKKQRAKSEGVRENQIAVMEVPFATFIRAFTKEICPLDLKNPANSDAFWQTDIGQAWKVKADNSTANVTDDNSSDSATNTKPETISWSAVYQGFKVLCPQVLSLSDIQTTSSHDMQSAHNNAANTTSLAAGGPVADALRGPIADNVQKIEDAVSKTATTLTQASTVPLENVVDSIKKHYAAILKRATPANTTANNNNTTVSAAATNTSNNSSTLSKTTTLINDLFPNKNTLNSTTNAITQIENGVRTIVKDVENLITFEKQVQNTTVGANRPELSAFLSRVERPPSFTLRKPFSKTYQ